MAFISLTDQSNGVKLIRLERQEKKNALCMALRDELEQALNACALDSSVRAVVLTGGDKIFSAGFDLREGQETSGRAFLHRFREFFRACYLFPKPVVSAVAGPALGGGFDLALMGDFILATPDARFGHPEIAFGPVAVTPLARFVSPALIRKLSLLGEPFDAKAAAEYGLVHAVVDSGELLPAALALAARLADLPPSAAEGTKQALARTMMIESSIEADADAVASLLGPGITYDDYVKKKIG